VVPYHQASILSLDGTGLSVVAQFGYRHALNRADEVMTSAPYALIMKHHQAIYIPNAFSGPAWRGMEVLGAPLAWMGVPLLANDQPLGLLSLGRNVERAFSSEERETVLGFAQRITDLLKREQRVFSQPAHQDTSTLQTDLEQTALFTTRNPVMIGS